MDIYFILWVIIQCYFIYFVAQIVPALAIGRWFSWLLCPFGIPPLLWGFFKNTSLLLDITRFSRFILRISCSSPTIIHFFKKPWFLLLENGIRNQDVGPRCVHCSWGVILRPSQLIKQRNTCVYIATCVWTHIYKYFYLYPNVSILSQTQVHTNLQLHLLSGSFQFFLLTLL